jgi:glycerate 2-kinase
VNARGFPPARDFLRGLFDAAVAAAQPAAVIGPHLPAVPAGRTIVLGAGKAAASMAAALEARWEGKLEGLVVVPYGHGVPTQWVEVAEAAHPVPDENGLAASQRILELARAAASDDLVICLLSGGASALLALPAARITLADKQRVNQQLLRCGAPIDAMNVVRKSLSAIKGGRLGAAIAPAAAVTLLISDVPGDSPSVVGSGPTVVDRGATAQAALAVVERYRLDLPDNVRSALTANVPTSTLPDNQSVVLIATAQKSLEAAARHAQALGVRPLILGDAVAGEAQQVAQDMADIVRQIPPDSRPCVLLSGGETSVTLDAVSGAGGVRRGGRNAEFLLALAVALEDCQGVCALACDTDGIDGSEDNAGAIVDSTTFLRADESGIDPREHLVRHDSYGFFAALDDLVVTGPTLTNVNDFRAIYLPAPTH